MTEADRAALVQHAVDAEPDALQRLIIPNCTLMTPITKHLTNA